jgi:hypothetical protein
MEGTDPLEFLKLSQGHDLLKLHVCKQQTLLSEIEIEISVNQQLQIKSDKTIKSLSLEDTQNEKQAIINKVQNTVENQIASSSGRRRLFNQYEMDLGQNGPGTFGMGSKLPSIPKNTNPVDMPYASPFEKANIMSQR